MFWYCTVCKLTGYPRLLRKVVVLTEKVESKRTEQFGKPSFVRFFYSFGNLDLSRIARCVFDNGSQTGSEVFLTSDRA